jgi:peptidoglycan/LPS O-acetylase OafA/YrhL
MLLRFSLCMEKIYLYGFVLVMLFVHFTFPEYKTQCALVFLLVWLILSTYRLLSGMQHSPAVPGHDAPQHAQPKHLYRSDIDGLRAYAIIPVVMYHAFPSVMPGGFIGVDVFFVISGFLITQILIEQNSHGTFTYRGFYERRIRRIFPAFMLMLVAVLGTGWFVFFSSEYNALLRHTLAGSFFLSNLLLYTEAGYFAKESYAIPLLHLWSLGIEEQFYIIWPIVIQLLRKKRTALFWTFAGLICASFITTQYLHATDGDAAFYWPISRLWELGLGGIVAWTLATYQIPYNSQHGRQYANQLSVVGFALLIFGFATITEDTLFPSYHALIPTLGTCMLILAGGTSRLSTYVLANRFMVFVGLISYPLYLWHWPILSFGMTYYQADFSSYLRFGAVLLAIVLAFLTYWLIERPVRATTSGRKIIPTRHIVAASFCVIVVATVVVLTPVSTPMDYVMMNLNANKTGQAEPVHSASVTCAQAGLQVRFSGSCRVIRHPDMTRTEYIVIGDSIAEALGRGFLAGNIDHPVLVMSKPGCAPLPGMERYRPASMQTFQCTNPRNVPAMYTTIAQNPANKPRVVFLAGLFTAIEGKKLNPLIQNVIRLQYKDRPIAMTKEEKTRDFRDSVNEMFDTLTKLPNTKIVFVYQTPALNSDPMSCIRRGLMGTDWGCPVPRHIVEAYNAQYRAIVDEVLTRYPVVDTFDPMQYMCDASNCYAAKDRQLLYGDDTHMNRNGALLLVREITKRYP